MKDILTKKRTSDNVKTIEFTAECSALLQNKSPPKLKDPGSFSIPCTTGTYTIDKALCDIGACVSVMPYTICENLNMGVLTCTSVTFQTADRSIKRPLGVLEDVSAKVRNFFIPVDFIVLEMAEDAQIPIILGRPFLHTASVVIDVKNGKLTLKVGYDKVTYNLNNAMKSPMLEEACYSIKVIVAIDVIVDDSLPRSLRKYPLEALFLLESFAGYGDIRGDEINDLEVELDGEELPLENNSQLIGLVATSNKVEVQKPELKPLPLNLKYAFLDESEMFPVIVSAHLNEIQLSSLLDV
ncbi:uncharacterized protein LOC141627893 [Silene latifolia]|uniref:uncharacterized protein LOC141627893 n=1 Tax=Silene latifolia TaxID=37657 RepID=UPI003D7755FD